MIPSQAIIDAIAVAIAQNTTWLANAAENNLYLVGDEFTPSPALTPGDLVLLSASDVAGLDPKIIGVGNQTVVWNSSTGQWGIFLKEPSGGFRWVATADPASPIFIYGVAVVNDAGDAVLGSARFPQTMVIAQSGDFIEVSAEFGFLPNVPVQGPLTTPVGVVAP